MTSMLWPTFAAGIRGFISSLNKRPSLVIDFDPSEHEIDDAFIRTGGYKKDKYNMIKLQPHPSTSNLEYLRSIHGGHEEVGGDKW